MRSGLDTPAELSPASATREAGVTPRAALATSRGWQFTWRSPPRWATIANPMPTREQKQGPEGLAERSFARDPWLWVILVLQTAISSPGVASRSLWLDETYSAVLARRTFSAIWAALGSDAGPPLYYDLLRLWRGVVGESEGGLRSLSVLCALATTVLLYRLARLLFDRQTARLSALLWAAHPLAVFYAGEARNYDLFALLAMLLVSALCELSAGRRSGRHLVIVGSIVALIYTHNVGWFCFAAALMAAAVVYRQAIGPGFLVLASGIAAVTYLPWVPTLRQQFGNSERSIWWMRGLWTPWSPLQAMGAFVPFGRSTPFIKLPASPDGWWPWLALVWVALALAPLMRRARPSAPHLRFLWLFLVLGLVLPVAWSAMNDPIVMPGRTDFFLLPVFLLLVAVGVGMMRTGPRYACAAVLVVSAATATLVRHLEPVAYDEREWISVLRARSRPGDVIICTNLTRLAAEYYLTGLNLSLLSYPRDMAQQLAHYNPGWYERHLDAAADASAVMNEADSRLQDGGRLWVVLSRHAINQPLMNRISHYGFVSEPPFRSPRMGLQRIDMDVAVLPFLKVKQPSGEVRPSGGTAQPGGNTTLPVIDSECIRGAQ
jgi:mannosyltransferase